MLLSEIVYVHVELPIKKRDDVLIHILRVDVVIQVEYSSLLAEDKRTTHH